MPKRARQETHCNGSACKGTPKPLINPWFFLILSFLPWKRLIRSRVFPVLVERSWVFCIFPWLSARFLWHFKAPGSVTMYPFLKSFSRCKLSSISVFFFSLLQLLKSLFWFKPDYSLLRRWTALFPSTSMFRSFSLLPSTTPSNLPRHFSWFTSALEMNLSFLKWISLQRCFVTRDEFSVQCAYIPQIWNHQLVFDRKITDSSCLMD